MNQLSHDFRSKTRELTLAGHGENGAGKQPLGALIDAWLAALEEEDFAGMTPDILASVLWQGFSRVVTRERPGCQVEVLRCQDGRGGFATALLIVNPDMPFLVDSIVMALRRLRIASRAVLNAVLSVTRGADGGIVQVGRAGDSGEGAALESFVLCVLSDELDTDAITRLTASIISVAADAAAVRRDAAAIGARLAHVAQAVAAPAVADPAEAANVKDGAEVAAFLDWAKGGGFEAFGYAYYHVVPGAARLQRDLGSRLGVLQDTSHPLYDSCLVGIPEDFDTLAARPNTLSIVKADAESTLHRDQQLDFFGVRQLGAQGAVLGEHCFVGLFSRSAMATPVTQLPFARGRIQQVLNLAGVRNEGFRAEKFLEILESLPRTEVLEASPEWLANVCSTVVALYKQPRAKVFVRPDVYGRHLNVLIYMPRERYSASLAERLSTGLRSLSGATEVRSQTLLSDGPLARLHLIASAARPSVDVDSDIAHPLLAAVEGWHTAFDQLVDGADAGLRSHLRKLRDHLPGEYSANTSPQTVFDDLSDLLATQQIDRVRVHIDVVSAALVNIRLLAIGSAPSLSQILPALHNAGVAVDREQTYRVDGPNEARFFVTCLTVDTASAAKLARPQVADAAQELFELLLNNEAEDGRMNGLVIEAALLPKQVQLVRAYASYWRQAGCRFSLRYIADCLRKQPVAVRTLVEGFQTRFNPELGAEARAAGTAALAALKKTLSEINHADTEDILRSFANLMLATLRTSYFQDTQIGDTIILKFDSSHLTLLPEPRPYREIFVFSRRFEGVHLRGGPVARGGLRWSDRMEDYRTEVLGLVKAQMVKNAVIVPAGAKGGFVCKMMPKDAARETIAVEGEAVYRLFIAGLLDMTDNRERGGIVQPAQTVCYDDADPYLVVAADKGTATFSDIANSIAVQRGFWLGDAFASGGSNGYDHKKLGITAKGAWEAVKRHFYEIGHDLNTTPITMVGVGDMSGDVFGNGVLLSHQLKLIAAFDHRHIFIDPTPDVESSFAERARMFALPRSSWDDYDKSLISTGGGVWPRTARSIDLSPEARAALGIEATSLSPEQLLHTILLAPVDLFYNGGIGTYIKASGETHAQVKDRANDAIRVDGSALRCKVVAEGGNLGATQFGRIEFAMQGGRIFTDAIDNSAGVDCSDHEVNVKIWLDTEVNDGNLSEGQRNRILTEITADIEALVLRDNTLQTHMLAREEQAQVEPGVLDAYAALITDLETEGVLSRELEQLPSDAELMRRKAQGRGLTAPELAVVIANVKNRYKRLLAIETLTDYSWAKTLLTPYFADGLVASREALEHPLANAILATVLANEAVNRCGPLMLSQLARSHSVSENEVIIAWAQAWSALNLAPVFQTLDAHALLVPREVSIALDRRTREMQRAVIQGVLSVPGQPSREATVFAELTRLFFRPGAAQSLSPVAHGKEQASLPADFRDASDSIAALLGMADFLFAALSVARPAAMSLPDFLRLGMELRSQTGIDRLERVLMEKSSDPAQEALRLHALQALRRAQQRLLLQALQNKRGSTAARIDVESAVGPAPTLEQAVLEAWTISEAAMEPAAA
jgi:glutamate dehydrogenase